MGYFHPARSEGKQSYYTEFHSQSLAEAFGETQGPIVSEHNKCLSLTFSRAELPLMENWAVSLQFSKTREYVIKPGTGPPRWHHNYANNDNKKRMFLPESLWSEETARQDQSRGLSLSLVSVSQRSLPRSLAQTAIVLGRSSAP